MKIKLLETDPPGAVGFEVGFRDHRQQQAVSISERLEPVLPRDGGEVSGGGNIHGGGQFQIRGGRLREIEILTVGNKQAASLIREEIAEVQFDVESPHARGIKLIDQIGGGNQDAGKDTNF